MNPRPRQANSLPGRGAAARMFLAVTAGFAAAAAGRAGSEPESLWSHVRAAADLGELRGMTATWDAGARGGLLRLATSERQPYAWATIRPPAAGWDLARRGAVEADIANTGTQPVEVLLWVVADGGWDAVPDAGKLAPGETRRFSCALRQTFPDGTPKLDPRRVKQVQVMLPRARTAAALEVSGLAAGGSAPEWQPPPDRLIVPPLEDVPPAPGRRVRFRPPGEEQAGVYGVLHLPVDWRPGAAFPVIVEFPGNIFFTPGCYSTGRPEQCVIGYGMTKGRGAVWLSLPFVDRRGGSIAENGWGDPDATAEYAVRMVEETCGRFGGDRRNVVLTGFSRGAIACGFIGLRNDRIAALWKGFHACQHYDGDGWNGATLEGALERARRFAGEAVFQTDNPEAPFRPVMEAMKARVTHARSGLGAHACAMFLDDRPSTRQLRAWFAELVAPRP